MQRAFSILIVFLLALTSGRVVAEKPNFLIFLADDMTYTDLGCYGNPEVNTPELDRLCRGGRGLQAGEPTRWSLLARTWNCCKQSGRQLCRRSWCDSSLKRFSRFGASDNLMLPQGEFTSHLRPNRREFWMDYGGLSCRHSNRKTWEGSTGAPRH